VVFLAVGITTIIALAPFAVREIGFFRVRQVEIAGTRYLEPAYVLARLGVEADRNVFDPLGSLRDRAVEIPGVVDAEVTRRLPGTVRVRVTERVAVAFTQGDSGLVALDALAGQLPYDPSRTGFDVPVADRPDSVVTLVLDLVRRVHPALYDDVDAARRGPGESVILELGDRRAWLNVRSNARHVRELETVRHHLDQHAIPFQELDARFDGWVVVRRERA
jgi:cell division septal protein FtsQ